MTVDLFTPLVAEQELHPNFKSLLHRRSAPDREVLTQWAEGFKDRDGKFVREFQTTFNSGFWELYLFACCKQLGFRVNLNYPAPDFVIDDLLNKFCIEAVIASNAQGQKSEWERDLHVEPDPNPDEVLLTATIRLSNAICSKHLKFRETYQSLGHVKRKPFVLAVAPFEQPYFFAQNDHAIRQVLYAYDRCDDKGNYKFAPSVQKKSGSNISLGLFTDDRMSEISAVIFSNTATLSKVHALNADKNALMAFCALRFNHNGPESFLEKSMKSDYTESLLDGLYVLHNPHATYPLPLSNFNHNDITQGSLLPGERVPRYKCRHGHLMQRSSMWLVPKEP